MSAPLKVGLAGLGTVGSEVVRMLHRQRDELAARCGRRIEVVAVTARSRRKDRNLNLRKARWADDPAALAADPGIDVFVELMGGEGDPAKTAVEAARWASDESHREEVLRTWARAGTPYEHWKEDFDGEPLRVRLNPNFDPFLVSRYKDAVEQAYRFRLSRARFDVDQWIDQCHSPLGRRLHCALARQGRLPARKVGRRWLVRGADLDAFIAEHGGRPVMAVQGSDDGGEEQRLRALLAECGTELVRAAPAAAGRSGARR